jgi:hypothetical protein
MPSLRACWRSAPIVRFIILEILATGVLAFECLRSSACIVFVHCTRVRFFVFLANECSEFEGARLVSHRDISATDKGGPTRNQVDDLVGMGA